MLEKKTNSNEKKEWHILINYSLISALISTVFFGVLWHLSNNPAGSALVPLFTVTPIMLYLAQKKIKKIKRK